MLTSLLIENGKKKDVTTEMKELDAFFRLSKTHLLYHKMADGLYADYGIDGYRSDTVKHTEASVWADFKTKANAFATWKKKSNKVLEQQLSTPLPKYTTITLVMLDFGDKK
jgi:alpha-amylase